MKKRIFALFLSVLLLATVLCACGDTKQEEAGSAATEPALPEQWSMAVKWSSALHKTWETVLTRIR